MTWSLRIRSIVHVAGLCLAALLITMGCSHEQAQQQHRHQNPTDIKAYLARLDRAERDDYQQPQAVIEALNLSPGMAVADLGSGSGYFTRRFAEAVTTSGTVYAIDVEPEMLAYVRAQIERQFPAHHVKYLLAEPGDATLPPQSVDLIFLCNTFHHLEERVAYFTALKAALTPQGRIAIIDFYHDERSGPIGFPRHHLVPKDKVLDELRQAGYRLVTEHHFLPRQYFLEFALAR